jgi:hypothetical protein
MLADKLLQAPSSPVHRHRRRRNQRRILSLERFRGKSILDLKCWLPHFFLLLTMGLVVAIILTWILGGLPLIAPFLRNIFEFWGRMAILITCLMTLVSINESIS